MKECNQLINLKLKKEKINHDYIAGQYDHVQLWLQKKT